MQRMSEHQDACRKGSRHAVAEHAWKVHHPILWEETRVIDRAEERHPRINRDLGLQTDR